MDFSGTSTGRNFCLQLLVVKGVRGFFGFLGGLFFFFSVRLVTCLRLAIDNIDYRY